MPQWVVATATRCSWIGVNLCMRNSPMDRMNRSSPTAAATLLALDSSDERGLASSIAAERLHREGPNDVPEARAHPILRFLGKFWGLSAWMVELIAILSFLLH